jgi:hypothetical protein
MMMVMVMMMMMIMCHTKVVLERFDSLLVERVPFTSITQEIELGRVWIGKELLHERLSITSNEFSRLFNQV